MLLSRDKFREFVFKRDGHSCVFCGEKSELDAHHIIERRLFSDGGYYLDNGVTVCQKHHLLCEQTIISVKEIREKLSLKKVIPEHFYEDVEYDKWGNIILPNGSRIIGELFFDESVQKALKSGGVLELFSNKVKYPRTYHLPWSPGKTKDDRTIKSTEFFEGKSVVVTLKMDGENTTLYNDYLHARSLEFSPRVDRDWIKAFHAKISPNIPDGWRICGENLWAEHSIKYSNLESPFLVFSIWNEKNQCLPWDDTQAYADMLGLKTVPVLYAGIYNENTIKNLHKPSDDGQEREGYVLRVAEQFSYSDFRKCVAKYVRSGHVNTQAHWTRMIKQNPFDKKILRF